MSARFQRALAVLLSQRVEGFYSNDQLDPGGETVWGIARRRHPSFVGWLLVDAARRLSGFPESLRGNAALFEATGEFYRSQFWNEIRAEDLPLEVGERVFDIAVNASPHTAGVLLQVAICGLDVAVKIDGGIGQKTIDAARRIERTTLYDALQVAQGGFYVGRGTARFIRGWLNRALHEDEIAALDRIDVDLA